MPCNHGHPKKQQKVIGTLLSFVKAEIPSLIFNNRTFRVFYQIKKIRFFGVLKVKICCRPSVSRPWFLSPQTLKPFALINASLLAFGKSIACSFPGTQNIQHLWQVCVGEQATYVKPVDSLRDSIANTFCLFSYIYCSTHCHWATRPSLFGSAPSATPFHHRCWVERLSRPGCPRSRRER